MATVDKRTLSPELQRELDRVLTGPLPRHVAITMDGNGRWAKRFGMDRTFGHREGVEVARRIVEFCVEPLGLEALTLYAFSTENWSRPAREVAFLMELMQRFLREQVERMVRKNVRLRVLGAVERLPDPLQHEIARAVAASSGNTGLQLNLAVNYGGRQEIVCAVRALVERAARGELHPEQVSEATVARALFTHGLPDPDLVIRTAEQRLSNFLLWQSAYAEFWTTPVAWPEFSEAHLLQAVADFQGRRRTFGGL